jgi:hypothetical protein
LTSLIFDSLTSSNNKSTSLPKIAQCSSHQLVACFRNDIRSIVHLSLKSLTHPINGSFFFYISDR